MFIHLHCHSHYSFLRGVASPEEIVAAAVEQKMPAVALTDTNGMYAAVGFYQAALKAGVKPIVGVTLDVAPRNDPATIPRPRADKDHPDRVPERLPTGSGQVGAGGTGRTFAPFGSAQGKRDDRQRQSGAIVLLATDMEGYSNLCRLVTLRHLGTTELAKNAGAEEDDGRAVTLEELAEHSRGVIALAPMEHLQKTGGASPAPTSEKIKTAELKEIFGERLWIEVQHLSPGDGRALREAEKIGRELGVRLVATNHVHFLRPEEYLHHRAVNAVRTGGLLTTVTTPNITTGEAWFKPAIEMQRIFPDHPEVLRATMEIAERCNLQLELGKLIFPEFPVPQGESPFSYLWKLSFEGARKRYDFPRDREAVNGWCDREAVNPLRPEVLSRLTHELEVIEQLKLAPYFLLVWDIVEEARRRGIPAVARGSAASSMVTYCLGISCVCPLRWGLYFERFLNVQRGDCPDIDIDICGARRDELLDYVYERWGTEHVAMIGSFITMHARLAVREIAKVFGVPPGEVNHFTKRLPHRPVREILQAIRGLPECRNLPVNDEPWKTILQVALRLDDVPRHLGIHPCGTVIAARALTHLVPLERATKGIVVTQYDMNAIEALGLIKMDLLGQRGLTTMSLTLDNIEKTGLQDIARIDSPAQEEKASCDPSTAGRQNHPDRVPERLGAGGTGRPFAPFGSAQGRRDDSEVDGVTSGSMVAPDGETPRPKAREIDFAAIPENDPATCDVMAAGQTMGVFQIESPGMRGLLRTMKARTLEEIAAALALIRPGASEYGSKELFLKRLRGPLDARGKQEPVAYAHASLEKILGDTLGVCIYQEQVMQIAQAVGSMSLQEADLVRRSAAKFSGQRERERLHGKFLKAAEQMGLTGTEREETWRMVEKFAGFGFCKAHAATYAEIAYRMTYLKTHYTAEFLAAMCSAGAGFYHVSAYVEEAKRWGIEVRLPSVNHSRMEYTTEASEDGRRAMRVGLLQVKGLRVETIAAMMRAREEGGTFHSLEDFLRRVPVERDEMEALIKCGAFDEMSDEVRRRTRPEMLWRWNLLQGKGKSAQPRMAVPLGAGRAGMPVPPGLFAEAEDAIDAAMEGMPTAEYTQEQKLRYEREILEVCVSGHPLDFLPRNGEAWSDELPGLRGKRVTLCGWVVTYRHVGTKNYRNMMFVTLEDQRGVYEVVLFPEAYERYGGMVYETRAMRVTGRVEEGGQINGEVLEALKR